MRAAVRRGRMLRECLEGLDGQAVSIDFSAVSFMDASGVNVLAAAVKRAHAGGDVAPVLRGVQPTQMRILELTGVAEHLSFDSDEGVTHNDRAAGTGAPR